MTITRRLALGAAAGTLALPNVVRAQAETFRIGALNPITGAGSPYGTGMQRMIQAAVEAINSAGGVNGRRIEVFAEDTQTSPQAAVLAAKKLIEVNRVRAILGTWSSGVSLAVIPLTNEADILLMHTSGAPALSTPPANAKNFGYRYQATNDRFGRAFAEIAVREGFRRPATMAFNNASGIGNTDGFRRAWAAKGNQNGEHVVYEPNQPSYRAELLRVLSTRPDVIVMGSFLPDTTIILREWFQTGTPVKWIIPAWAANPQLVQALGPAVTNGIIAVDSVSNEGAEAFTAYDAAYRRAMNQPGASNVYAAMTWDMANTLALAIEQSKSFETGVINAAIRQVANPPGEAVSSFAAGKAAIAAGRKINYEGASSVLDFDEFGDVTPDFGVFFIENGQFNRRYVVKI
ncbi:ABC transporter substrate-binding protein [Neoroseomonas oryzicola]|uniref:Amino acid ABC transporter substrate-binding protein n=1 Tax=Neoroseomonas oryzicola TaxID=535904 RepID=A0A9X9WBM0_9PROT|nr:ABC transporter substrate-binding protein [Neoroseomonas oryzicola]MBR0657730.1 amino acid ABC transporter substrate-binding protein [Neoroseomonas oryzicola]NKE18986.1 amino acid ABC transporter substrate-binding protein [Neoroseomonas oryzicola]